MSTSLLYITFSKKLSEIVKNCTKIEKQKMQYHIWMVLLLTWKSIGTPSVHTGMRSVHSCVYDVIMRGLDPDLVQMTVAASRWRHAQGFTPYKGKLAVSVGMHCFHHWVFYSD